MAFWQPLRLTHALREIPEHSSAKALGKSDSSMLDASAGDSALQGGEFFRGFYSLARGLLCLYFPDHSSWPSPFMLRSPLMLLRFWLRSRGITEIVTIINVPLQDPVLPVLSFLANESAPLLFPLMAINVHQCLYPKW